MSKIEWTGETWNPVSGCSRKSAGCQNCYAETMTKRLAAMGNEKYAGLLNDQNRFNGVIKFDEKALLLPLKTKKPTTYFVNSMSDLFHENVKDEWIDQVFAVMALCPQHTFQILTKRADRMMNYVPTLFNYQGYLGGYWLGDSIESAFGKPIPQMGNARLDSRLPNVWLGVSVENQQTADERIPHLLDTPAAVRFLSCEPLLEEIDIAPYLCLKSNEKGEIAPEDNVLGYDLPGISWVIVGGESGRKARVCEAGWIYSILQQCQSTNVPTFVKQLGANFWIPQSEWRAMSAKDKPLHRSPGLNDLEDGMRTTHFKIFTKNKKGGDIAEFPAGLRIREIPKIN